MQLVNQEQHIKQIENGIAYLNSLLPTNWQEKINLDKLDIGSCECCVLGQIWYLFPTLFPPQEYQYSAYSSVLRILFKDYMNTATHLKLIQWSHEHGFSVEIQFTEAVNDLWRTKLRGYKES